MSPEGHEYLFATYERFFGRQPEAQLEEWEVARVLLLTHQPPPPGYLPEEREVLLLVVETDLEVPFDDVREHFHEIAVRAAVA